MTHTDTSVYVTICRAFGRVQMLSYSKNGNIFFGPISITINFLTFHAQLPLGLSSMVFWINNCMGCYNLRVLVIFASPNCVSFCFVSYQLPNVANHCFKESCFQWNNNDFSIINWFFIRNIYLHVENGSDPFCIVISSW